MATNVTKLALAGAAQDSAGTEQRMFYNKGVGTARFEHVLAAAVSWTLKPSANGVLRDSLAWFYKPLGDRTP